MSWHSVCQAESANFNQRQLEMKTLCLLALSTLLFLPAFGQTELYEFNPSGDDIASNYGVFNDMLIITAFDPDDGFETFISDGTTAGTSLMSDIDPGSGSSLGFFYTEFGDHCLFRAIHPTYGQELWITDGTDAGTMLLKDIYPGNVSGISEPQIVVMGDYAYFAANDGVYGEELWRTDGTSAGTERLTDINDDQMSAQIKWMTAADTKIFFVATDDWDNHELYVHAPAFDATYEVDDINNQSSTSSFDDFWPIAMAHFQGDEVMFAADDGGNGKELWTSNSSGGGTYMVKDINPSGDSNPFGFYTHNGLMYFFADDGTHGVELWVSDGTESGTTMVIDVASGFNDDAWIVGFGEKLIFKTSGSGSGSEIFITDGTESGTTLLDQIDSIQPDHPAGEFEGLYFFGGLKSGSGIEVYATDGTPEGTGFFADVDLGFSHGQPHYWQLWDDKLWFMSNDNDGHNLYYITPEQAQGFCDLPNDECAGAQMLTVNGIATQDKSFSCALDEGDQLCGASMGNSLWYQFIAPASGIVDYEIGITGQGFGDFNPAVSIVAGSCGAQTEIQCLDNNLVNEDEVGSVSGLTSGETYFLILHDPAGGKGLYSITLTEGEGCIGDYSGDGVVNNEDLLDFLVYYGCLSDCDGDLNGDDYVLGEDLLIFLAAFGNICN